mgnify:CR=1 FL=1
MNISNVKTFTKVADLILDPLSKKYFEIKWYTEHKEFYTDEVDRIYIITENDIIKKIGGSACKGGLFKTITTYRDSSLSGKPSPRTFGIPVLINESLNKGNNISIYGMLGEKIIQKIKGLYDEDEIITSPNYKHSEDKCLIDYNKIYNRYPDWNFQENGEEWPSYILEQHKNLVYKKKNDTDENTN